MRILFVGKKGFNYNRTKILFDGLKKIQDVNVEIFILEKKKFNKSKFHEKCKDFDFIYVPPFRFSDAKFIYKRANIPVIFDPLVSSYLTKVVDYKQFWKAPQKYIADKQNLSSCDILIADTESHRQYFSRKFKIPLSKIEVLPVGVDTSNFFPKDIKNKDSKFHVGFYGGFIPLQGIEKIIETAKILQNDKTIIFDIIGSGHLYKKIIKLSEKYKLSNVIFHGRVKYTELSEKINLFDICLGIFGDSLKADLVIPNKIYHYSALKKCIITKNTQGIKEIFTNNENVILSSNNPQEIAEKILFLKKKPKKRDEIALNSYQLITQNYNEIEIAKKFIKICLKHK